MKQQPADNQYEYCEDFLDQLKEIVQENNQRREELTKVLLMAEEAKKKEEFIMNISYEIRTPLNMILGFTQLLSEMGDSLSVEEKAQMGEHIRKGTDTLTELLTDVLQFTRLESGRVQTSSETVDVAQLVQESVEQHRKNVPEGVQLAVKEGTPGVIVMADKVRMGEILHQYINNALRHTKQGSVDVGWDYQPENGEVLIHVKDTGCGIAAEKQPKVFSLFWKEDEFAPGIGIGLTLVKKYAELMGGKLFFSSRYGEGCDFGVLFPARLRS